MADTIENKALSPRQPFNGQRVRRIPGRFKLSTWNVRSIFESGKTHNVIKKMKRLGVHIMGLSETQWPGSGQCNIQNHTIYYSEDNDPEHRNGVGIIVNQGIKTAVRQTERNILHNKKTKTRILRTRNAQRQLPTPSTHSAGQDGQQKRARQKKTLVSTQPAPMVRPNIYTTV
ncbi:hypothetical protein RN001_008632 [Aquatica leii]|uniref:Craniofacial development protein 2-like n=1 Tax=Aquatica leii TaxID=1421715 RepID=A0AAN7S9S4_9COLE|nr:hypothetical protein RN001_008632 [Aquatica leii]